MKNRHTRNITKEHSFPKKLDIKNEVDILRDGVSILDDNLLGFVFMSRRYNTSYNHDEARRRRGGGTAEEKLFYLVLDTKDCNVCYITIVERIN